MPANQGAAKFAKFLEQHGISKSEASRALHVTHVSIINWLAEKSVPEPNRRPSIEIWTNGEVPAVDWLTKQEAAKCDELASIVPFSPAEDGAAR